MAGRKFEIVKAPLGCGRDHEQGKHFKITEWGALRADTWANATLLAYTRGGVKVPESMIGRGMEGIFFVGVQCFLSGQIQAKEIQPLLNELFECVEMVRDPNARDRSTGLPVAVSFNPDIDVDEIKTLWWLRSEVLRIHTGFSPAAVLSDFLSRVMVPPESENMSTSQEKSA